MLQLDLTPTVIVGHSAGAAIAALRAAAGGELAGMAGGAALAQDRDIAAGTVTIWATLGTRQAMEQRCPACLDSLTARVGADAMDGTHIVWPTATLFEDVDLNLFELFVTVTGGT